jgi:cytochrome c biogenesis protein CcmG, thiol:disulfide interchange protein DsbE
MRWRTFFATAATLLVAFLLAVLLGGNASPAKARLAPALPTQVLVGPRVDIAGLRGRPAIIHFWASWCGPCVKEAPQLARLASELHGRATLVGVDWSDSRSSAASFVRQHQWTFTVLIDSSGEVGSAYGISGLPTTFLLDRHGGIVRRLIGPQTAVGLLASLPKG